MKLGSAEGLKSVVIPLLRFRITWISAAGYFCYIVSFLFYTNIITRFDLGVIVPVLSGIVNLAVLVIALLLLKERVTTTMIGGALLICIGIVLIQWKR